MVSETYSPRPYQKRIDRFVYERPAVAQLVDMGLGKTASTLTAIARLVWELESKGALVFAPIKVIQETWPEEIAKWAHLRHLRVSIVHGSPKQRLAALKKPADIYLTNYENMIWLADWMHDNDRVPFDTVIYDESSKMKAHDSIRFKRWKHHVARFRRRVLLTGTPAPNSYLDLWAQFYLLDEGKRLGKYFTHFRDKFFVQADFMGYNFKLRAGFAEKIEALIADISITLRSEDHITLPKMLVNDIKVPLPPKLQAAYEEFEREMFAEVDGEEVEAFSAASVTAKCAQFTAGALYDAQEVDEDGDPIGVRTWKAVHDEKLKVLDSIVEEAQGSPILLMYHFKHSLARLTARYKGLLTPLGAPGWKKRWDAGALPILAAHPASAGHGLNLQFGGHIQVWYDLTYSLEFYQQSVKRLHRPGQKKPVMIHRLIAPRTVDVAMVASLSSKDKGQSAFLNALKAYRSGKKPLKR